MGQLLFGVCHRLEEQADQLLADSMRGESSRSAKGDVLTPWKMEDRLNHEVYTASGVADPAVRRGMYNRAWNPRHQHLNSRDGHYPSRKVPVSFDGGFGGGEEVGGED